MSLVILDRDGVINVETGEHVKSPDEWIAIEGSLQAVARLNHAGFRVVIATNQSGLARKLFDIETLNKIHAKMQRQLGEVGAVVEAVFFCPHADKDGCECRKPKPGLLLDISSRLRMPLDDVPMIGDSWRDVNAARACGARPILVRSGRPESTHVELPDDIEVYADLAAAADALVQEKLGR
ncbi:MAG: D-glycero-beta-D-manno-heptose-1,7-bisphosphate 7-phosphatase [Thiotrichales bacterium]|nr:D-glycero-beta-D-manno-heptose-1,7-bisphosphate 7-phosphatase [Thiotrichales bacterium]